MRREIILTTVAAAGMQDYGRKATTLVLENEEIYIMHVVLPAAGKYTLWNMIKDELIFKFGNIGCILFDFELRGKKGQSIEAIVYCINFDIKKIASDLKSKGGILKGVYPLQFYVLRKYRKHIGGRNYFLVFLFRNRIYLIAAVNNILIMNKIIHYSKGLNEQDFEYQEEKIRDIYLINIKNEEIKSFLPPDFRIVELKPLSDNTF
ncbi:MAG: hypothetical protein AB9844_10775 [Clostridiaceae bacterium]